MLHGAESDRPVTVVENASRPNQIIIYTTLHNLPDDIVRTEDQDLIDRMQLKANTDEAKNLVVGTYFIDVELICWRRNNVSL